MLDYRSGLAAAALFAVTMVSCAMATTGLGEDGDGDGDGDAGGGGTGGGGGTAGAGGGALATCNDGAIDPGEDCDGDSLAGWTCELLELGMGTLVCDPVTCTFDTSGCSPQVCGDGVKTSPEACDGTDFGGDTCASLGFAGGTIACDESCQVTGCYDDYVEGFESGLPTGWTSSGGAMWFASATSPHAGTQCAESGDISDNGTSTLSVTLTFAAAGSVSFWHREDTESCCDDLFFYVDGFQQASWAGNSGWLQHTQPVTAGTHTFTWSYVKDFSISSGLDAVWIDDFVATGGTLP